jgi:hypothetical protein
VCWRTLTRLWLLHRVAAYTIVRLAIGTVTGVVVAGLVHGIATSTASVIAAGVAVLATYGVNRVVPVISVALNPMLQVGDVVVLAEEFGAGIRGRPTYYVVGVALEGVQLVELESSGAPLPIETQRRTHDRTLDIKDVQRLLRNRRPYTGCRARCTGVNLHCPLTIGAPSGRSRAADHELVPPDDGPERVK